MKHLLESGFLTPLDGWFATMHEDASESERAFFAAVMRSARAGHLCLDLSEVEGEEAWQQAVVEGAKTGKSPHIVVEDGRAYLRQNYQCELDIVANVQRLCGRDALPMVETTLAAEQKKAFECVRSERFSIITGGPGTGKTFLIGEIAKRFERVILAAPTGKAASVLREKNPLAICGTVHALFGVREEKFVQADLIVVDEASMLDVKMARKVFKGLKTGLRLVLVGDGDQLPPVEGGSVFKDLIGKVPTVYLQTCLRSDRREIVEMAAAILAGGEVAVGGDLVWSEVRKFAEQGYTILTPLREGPWGVKVVNERLEQELQMKRRPIIIARNDKETGLANGEVGEVEGEFAYFEGREFKVSALPPYELAHVLSVHKSQGSEFDRVVVLAPDGSEVFGRQLLYTAVTRARSEVVLLGDRGVVTKMVASISPRKSGIAKRLADWKGGT